MQIEFTAPLDKHDSRLMWYYIVYIPKKLVSRLGKSKNPRIKATFNHSVVAHISVKSKGELRFLVVNGDLRKKLNLAIGEQVHVLIEEETNEYGMPMPEELALMLAEDELGSKYFHNLTPGKQRSLMYLVSKVKSMDSRIRKAKGILLHLNEFQGKLDFRALNDKIKELNQEAKLKS